MTRNTVYDACVLGAGIVGLYLATRLALQGKKVVIVEKGPTKLEENAIATPVIKFTRRKNEGVQSARNHVVGGNSAYWGGGLIRGRAYDHSVLLGEHRLQENGSLDRHYSSVEKMLQLPRAPSRWEEVIGQTILHRSEILVLPGGRRNIGKHCLELARGIKDFTILAPRTIVGISRGNSDRLRSITISDDNGDITELCAQTFFVCMGVIDSIHFAQEFASDLGLENRPELGRHLHDHLSLPLFAVHPKIPSKFLTDCVPGFVGSFIVGRRVEMQLDSESWNASGFLHFGCQFDEVDPYASLKRILNLRQKGGKSSEYSDALYKIAKTFPTFLKVGYKRIMKREFHISPNVPIFAIFDFESIPSVKNALRSTVVADGTEQIWFDWDVRDEDKSSFKRFFPMVENVMSLMAKRYDFEYVPLPALASASSVENYLIETAHDAFHLGGGLQAGNSFKDSVLRPDLRFHTMDNLYCISTAAFRRPGIANPVHTLLALADRLADSLCSQLQ